MTKEDMIETIRADEDSKWKNVEDCYVRYGRNSRSHLKARAEWMAIDSLMTTLGIESKLDEKIRLSEELSI
jgi:hypothetical protein